ncbi:hypothetical protein C4J96_5019 [Pseudomonas orientalis]|uniref:hypothetical protein n=1 Tax=Pseudomonas orientalis TaxID=76758 RepID=UPI000F6BCFDA|nr:hypothetical protein [Pseudomonas orientalis]AZE97087.1 hypothetical protein C4J96_5019 [Pseudomonas orientalis]
MSEIKRLNIATPQGNAGELSKGSQFSFAYATELGRKHCGVAAPGVIIERIAEAMSEALGAHQARVDVELFSTMRKEWDAGRAMALHDSVATGMRRKPVVKPLH